MFQKDAERNLKLLSDLFSFNNISISNSIKICQTYVLVSFIYHEIKYDAFLNFLEGMKRDFKMLAKEKENAMDQENN
jgi:hypothetical protein